MLALDQWITTVQLQSGEKLKAVRSDNAAELQKVISKWLLEQGTRLELTMIGTSSQNGPVGRCIQTCENSMRAMLKDASFPLKFWDEAVETDVYIRKRT